VRTTDTQRFRQWLAQFSASDQLLAECLARSLTLVSADEFQLRLMGLLKERVSTHAAAGAAGVAVYPVFEMNARANGVEPSYFTNTGGNHRMPNLLGSEGMVGHICTQLEREFDGLVLNRPTIEQLRSKRVPSIILVDDIIGSGRRAADFLAAMVRSKVRRQRDSKMVQTLCSWHSGGFVRFEIVAYAASEAGECCVRSCLSPSPEVFYWRRPRFSHDLGNARDVAAAKSLCERYGRQRKGAGRKTPLGFGNVFSGLVFRHKCPNTVPPILWGKTQSWTGLFGPKGTIPAELEPCFTSSADSDVALSPLAHMGQKRLAEGGWRNLTPEEFPPRLLVLAALKSRIRIQQRMRQGAPTPVLIAALETLTGLPRQECIGALDWCLRNGLIDWKGCPTDDAHAVLEYLRAPAALTGEVVTLRRGHYFPC